MQTKHFLYDSKKGWSVSEFPALDSPNTLVLIFGAPEYFDKTEPFKTLLEAYPNSHLVGCSGAGEIYFDKIHDNSISVAVTKFEQSRLCVIKEDIETPDRSFEVGKLLAKKLNQPDLKGVFVLSDGLFVNGSKLVNGLTEILDESVVVTGGLAGDGDRFEKTWTICNDSNPQSKQIVAVGFYGENIQIGYGSKGGWDIFGIERVITKSSGNVVYEIDNQPALSLYKEYLGDRASELPASALLFPLSIRQDSDDEHQLVRTILSIDEDTQSMTFAGEMPENWRAKLMRANFDRLIDGAQLASKFAADQLEHSSDNVLSIAISCVGRRLVLGEHTEEEVEATLGVLPKNTVQVGFYSYGEIAPNEFHKCALHNQTMTLTLISER